MYNPMDRETISIGISGDRFIPNRSAMDLEVGHYNLMSKENAQPNFCASEMSPYKQQYKNCLAQSLFSQATKPEECKILALKRKAPAPKEGFQNRLCVLYTQNNVDPVNSKKQGPRLPQAPERVLDAPSLLDDYYLNLLDWSSSNLLSIALSNAVYVWNATTSEITKLVELDEDLITSVSWAQTGPYLAVGTDSSEIHLWDVEKCKLLRRFRAHNSRVGALAWNFNILSSGSRDTTICHHDVRVQNALISVMSHHEQEVCGLKWSHDGTQLASGGNDNLLNIWDMNSSQPKFTLTEHCAAVKALSWCPWQSNLLATGGGAADRTIRFWNTATGVCLNYVDTDSQVCAIEWSRQHKQLASSHGFSKNQICVWKYPSMVKVGELIGHTSRVLHLALSPDGQTLASAAADETLRFWRVWAPRELETLTAATQSAKQSNQRSVLAKQPVSEKKGSRVGSLSNVTLRQTKRRVNQQQEQHSPSSFSILLCDGGLWSLSSLVCDLAPLPHSFLGFTLPLGLRASKMSMYLYNFSLQKTTAINLAVNGNFSGAKTQEIVVAKGHILEILRPEDIKLQSILSVDVFGEIRALLPFRLTGGSKDYLVVGSDSGRIVILEYNVDKNRWDRVHQETFGRSGCRRIVPGQMLAVDPKGRAVMIAAVEKQKFVYVLNRDASAKLTISSPLEAHKSHTLCYSIVGIDVGFENPLFAALELDYSECDTDSTGAAIQKAQKHLTFYELDLGLNHVVRKWTDPVDNKSNMLISVPGGSDGPGGVLVCSEDWITYKNQGHPDKRVRIPRRRAYGDTRDSRGVLIVAAAVHRQRTAGPFFLLQSEFGDLYKVTLDYVEDNVKDIKIKYFDTVPVATSLCVLRTGFLFVAAEYGNHVYYQIQSLGDDEEPTFKLENDENVYFKPRPLKNLIPADEIQSIAPVIDCKVLNLLNEEIPQIYCLCGRGSRSSLRILRHGIASTELGTTATNLSTVTGIYTIKRSVRDFVDRYILISFEQATLVLQVGDSITEVTDSRLSNTNATLAAGLMGEDGMVQIHTDGIRHTKSDGRTQEWKPPGGKKILQATCNTRQVVICVTGGDLYYFELDMAGNLIEIEKITSSKEIVALELPPVQENQIRARFLAIADGDNKLRIHSLEPNTLMNQLAVQALPARARSLCMAWMNTTAYESTETLYLAVGTVNGLLLRITIDSVTGQLSDTRTRFVGTKPTKVQRIRVREQNAILVISSRAWLIHSYQGRIQTSAISYRQMDHAAGFSSEACPEAIVCIAQNALRIWALERLDESFNQVEIPLRYTPRRFDVLPGTNLLCIIEAEHNSFPYFERQKIKERLKAEEKNRERGSGVVIKQESVNDDAMEIEGSQNQSDNLTGSASETQALPIEQQVDPRPGIGRWASCIRLLDVSDLENVKTTDLVELEDNEACVSMCTCKFHDNDETFLCVGTVKDLILEPKRSHSGGFIHVYRYQNDNRLTLVHKTPVEDVPGALCAFQGRLLAGVGRVLRIYDLGKKKLLRKCENKNFPNQIVSIHVISHRIIVGDVQESIHFVKYLKPENSLVIFADDTSPRWLTSIDILDFDTVVGGDKFGNVFVLRLPDKVSQEVEDDITGSKAVTEMGQLNGAPYKVELVCGIFLNEAITKVLKTSLTRGGAEVILYTTISGAIGCLLPFQSREDVDFFSRFEMHMRQENPPLCGRDHLHYRSYYFPVKNVIDGDLCEQYPSIEYEKQRKIAEDLERSPAEVQKKLEDMRNML